MSYGQFIGDCQNWDSQRWLACFRIFNLATVGNSKSLNMKVVETSTSFCNGQEIEFWMSGVKVMGLERRVRKLGQNLLVLEERCIDFNFGNSLRTDQFSKNYETFRVDV